MKLTKLVSALALACLMSMPALAKDYDLVVAQDGSGDFRTVLEAVNAVPDYRKVSPTRIFIKKGVYKERIIIPGSKDHLQLIGEEGTVITFDAYASKPNIFGEPMGTSGSSSVYIYGPDFVAENITFENSAGPVGQAVACHISADRVTFRHCRFLGFQDTLYTYGDNSREYYEDCYIEGTVDFIFGRATAVFNRCEIRSKLDGGYVTAPATPKGARYGYVFYDCKLTADPSVPEGSVYLSRPWRPYGQCVYINCEMGRHINPAGFNNWDNPDNEKTAYYAEYGSKGEGSSPARRVSWSHQLENLKDYDINVVLAGKDGWDPISDPKSTRTFGF